LRALGQEITQPWVFLKACATGDELRALLPPQWQLQREGFLMACGARPFAGRADLPPGYAMQVDESGPTRLAQVRVFAPDGALAARGRLALGEAFATYHDIVTEPSHQRRGLARAVMHALQRHGRAHGRAEGVLVASPQGRLLYESLGWRHHAPWSTAVILGPQPPA
jgi:GNAT superfamily N-acetyltransferase